MEGLTTINTIRHAQTYFNTEKRYAGSIDISISEQGALESRKAAAKLVGMQFDIVITSTLKRTLETAQILMSKHSTIVQSNLCRERNFGIFEGQTIQEVHKIESNVLWIKVGTDMHSVNPHGSEPFEKVWERAYKFRNWLFKKYAGKNILIVSHGVFLQMLHGLFQGLSCIESLAIYPSNLELATFTFDGKRLVKQKLVKLISSEGTPDLDSF